MQHSHALSVTKRNYQLGRIYNLPTLSISICNAQ